MAKIPFDIKYRPQIESGEYKAILECGVEAEILAWDEPGEYPIICVAKKDDAIPFRTDGNGKAYHYPEGANYSDLFLVTPEEELTEFEDGLRRVCEEAVKEAMVFPERTSEDFAKAHSAKLLALARKEIVDEWSRGLHDTQDRSGKAYNDGYQLGFERGCEALKDLPRWSKNAITRGCAAIDISGLTEADYIRRKGKLLSISDLEKLPGFKED